MRRAGERIRQRRTLATHVHATPLAATEKVAWDLPLNTFYLLVETELRRTCAAEEYGLEAAPRRAEEGRLRDGVSEWVDLPGHLGCDPELGSEEAVTEARLVNHADVIRVRLRKGRGSIALQLQPCSISSHLIMHAPPAVDKLELPRSDETARGRLYSVVLLAPPACEEEPSLLEPPVARNRHTQHTLKESLLDVDELAIWIGGEGGNDRIQDTLHAGILDRVVAVGCTTKTYVAQIGGLVAGGTYSPL